MFPSGHIIAVSILDVIGIGVNIAFLFRIKTRAKPPNAIDVLQASKTCFIMISLVVCVWLELVTCSETGSWSRVCYGAKAILNDLFFYSSLWTFVAVAYVRRKVCNCRGRASVLITHRHALTSMLLCLSPIGMFVAATISVMLNHGSHETSVSHYYENGTHRENIPYHTIFGSVLSETLYELCHVIFINSLPILISSLMYVRIFQTINQTAQNAEGFISQRNRNPTKIITISIVVLLSTTFSVWAVYIIVKTISVFRDVTEMFFVYWKLIIMVTHPFSEGLLMFPTRKTTGESTVTQFIERSSVKVCPSAASSMASMRSDFAGHRLAEQLPALIEDKELQQKLPEGTSNKLQHQCATRKRRESLIHIRPSVLEKHAAYIGLECRDKHSIVTQGKTRRESEERLRKSLKEIGQTVIKQQKHNTSRRLSTLLRLETISNDSDEEMYADYNSYRRGSHRSNKSHRIKSISEEQEYKGLPYAQQCVDKNGNRHEQRDDRNNNGKKLHDGRQENSVEIETSVTLSPSQRRWKKMLTTAISVKRFHKGLKEKRNNQTNGKRYVNHVRPADTKGSSFKGSSDIDSEKSYSRKGSPICDIFTVSGNSETTGNGTSNERKFSNDNNKGQSTSGNPATKTRSISCVNNTYIMEQMIKNSRTRRERNKSVSFISRIKLDDPRSRPVRSFSCEIGDGRDKLTGSRNLSFDDVILRNSTESSDTYSSLRRDSMQKLNELKNYF